MVVRTGCSSHTCRNGEYDEADYDMCWARWMIVMMMQKPKRLPMLPRLCYQVVYDDDDGDAVLDDDANGVGV